MANIADLFARLMVDDRGFEASVTKSATRAGDKSGKALSGPLNKQLDAVGVKAGGLTGLFGKLGNATGGLVTPTTVAAGAFLGLAGFILDAGKAAGVEQVNVAKMGASLRANVKDWDGNTDAIEKTIAARQELAFSDDALRNSLALLVPATKDVNKALDLQATAMDLARLKGISLEEASTALIKIEGGQFRALKALIGSTKDIKTAEQALAAVRRVAGGQAKAYSETLVGQQEALGIAFDNLQEDLGALIVGPLTDFTKWVREDGIPGLKALGKMADDVTKQIDEVTSKPKPMSDPDWTPVDSFIEFGNAVADVLNQLVGMPTIAEAAKKEQALLDEEFRRGEHAADGFADAADDAGVATSDLSVLMGGLRDAAGKAESAIGGVVTQLVDELFGRASRAGREAGLEKSIRELRKELSTTKDKADAKIIRGQIADLRGELFQLRFEEAKAAGPQALLAWFLKEEKAAEKTGGKIRGVISNLRALADIAGDIGHIKINVSQDRIGGKAGGGPVRANTPYWVGENRRRELFIPEVNGQIATEAQARAMPGVGGGPVTNNFITNVEGLVRARTPHEVGDALRRLADFGVLTPPPRWANE